MALATSIPIILFFIVGLCCSGKIAYNGLRVGDVALCCPAASGRQGNIAYTLLAVCTFSHLF
jgi:hypothetical protein